MMVNNSMNWNEVGEHDESRLRSAKEQSRLIEVPSINKGENNARKDYLFTC